MNLVLFRLILLNEQDILDDNQQKYQRLCYVTLLNRSDFISSEDISKLRQRNPSTIREAEHDKEKEIVHMNLKLNAKEGKRLSSHISRLCTSGGQESAQIYARSKDLMSLAPDIFENDYNDSWEKEDDLTNDLKKNQDAKDDLKDEIFKSNNMELKRKDEKMNDANTLAQIDKKENKDDLYKNKMKNRCFMQKFKKIIVDNKIDYSVSNYEKLKFRLRRQMMDKSTKDKKEPNREDYKFKKSIVKNDDLVPKSLNDFINYWRNKNSNKKLIKITNLFHDSKRQVIETSTCYCKIEICIPWYPCQVKYCRTTDRSSKLNTHLNKSDKIRCGIESCKKCWLFYFDVDDKNSCFWDE